MMKNDEKCQDYQVRTWNKHSVENFYPEPVGKQFSFSRPCHVEIVAPAEQLCSIQHTVLFSYINNHWQWQSESRLKANQVPNSALTKNTPPSIADAVHPPAPSGTESVADQLALLRHQSQDAMTTYYGSTTNILLVGQPFAPSTSLGLVINGTSNVLSGGSQLTQCLLMHLLEEFNPGAQFRDCLAWRTGHLVQPFTAIP